ncbi:MAG: response regulator [Phycisphaerales bacterium]
MTTLPISPTPDTPRRRILVADDAAETTLLLSRVLSKAGYEVLVADDGRQCLDRFETFKPHVVIVDIMMPNVHGMDVLRQIKAGPRGADVAVIVISARAFEPDKERAINLGAYAYLIKPVQRSQLLEILTSYFAGNEPAPTGISHPSLPATEEVYLPELDSTRGTVKLFGARGSTPVPGHSVGRYGGNTSCLEIRHGKEVVILDAGSGIRECGLELAKQGPRPIHLFIGHTHWDHIQGFPFFAPAYIPGFEITIYGASGFGKDLRSIFQGQLDHDYFPVDLRDMKATMRFQSLTENPTVIGDISVHWEYAHHPGATVCFKVDVAGTTVGYLTDNEFLRGYLGHPNKALGTPSMLLPYAKIIQIMSGVDHFIAEAQYNCDEYLKKIGWGHTSISNACVLAKLAGIRRWYLTHHDPTQDDAAVDRKISLIRQILREIECPLEVTPAFDGMMIYL